MDDYDRSTFPELILLLARKDVATGFAATLKGRDEGEIRKLTAYGEKLHRHLESSFPSISREM
jgi:hypothetical protein